MAEIPDMANILLPSMIEEHQTSAHQLVTMFSCHWILQPSMTSKMLGIHNQKSERIPSQRYLFVFEIKNEWSITIEIHWSAKPICLHSLSRINNIWNHWLGCPWCFFNADYIFGYRVSSMLLPKLIENSFKHFPKMTCFYSFISRYIIHNYWWLLRRN